MVNVFYPHQHIVVDQPTGDVTVVAGGMPGIPGIPGPPGGVTKEELNLALAGKAPTTHTHTMGQVTGLDTALEGKANATTLDTRVPSTLALRVDTTVGTRIFAGNTMIFGDTNWRNVSASLMNGWTGTVWLRRKGDQIIYRFTGVSGAAATASQLLPGFPGAVAINSGKVSFPYLGRTVEFDIPWNLNGSPLSTPDRGSLSGEISFHTKASWPATLPGLPA